MSAVSKCDLIALVRKLHEIESRKLPKILPEWIDFVWKENYRTFLNNTISNPKLKS